MKVGDLVKVYNFSRRARKRWPGAPHGYMMGMIVSDTTLYRSWSIQLCKHNITEIYREDRLEVINENKPFVVGKSQK